jgi:hypothetical protein
VVIGRPKVGTDWIAVMSNPLLRQIQHLNSSSKGDCVEQRVNQPYVG